MQELTIESKNERFYRIIEPRINRCIKVIHLLAYGADRNRYAPTAEDVDVMEKVLQEAVRDTLGQYRMKANGKPNFSFRVNHDLPVLESVTL